MTEWDHGVMANEIITADASSGKFLLAANLARLAKYYGFDGWLVNLEAMVFSTAGRGDENGHSGAQKIRDFLSVLTHEMHKEDPNSVVLWYDSVSFMDGRVAWKSCLDEANEPFVRVCDGLFHDYKWKEHHISRTLAALDVALTSPLGSINPCNIFAGVDVWGRGSFGGGKWNLCAAADVLSNTWLSAASSPRRTGLSIAVFGPAWTYEDCGGSASSSLLHGLDERLWTGAGAADDASPLVENSSGQSGNAACWTQVCIGGDGWKVETLSAADSPDPTIASCFVASYDWCEMEQVVKLSSLDLSTCKSTGIPTPAPKDGICITVSEFVQGTGPIFEDPYSIAFELVNSGGQAVSPACCYRTPVDSKTSHRWKLVSHTFTVAPIPSDFFGVKIVHGGKSAEHWAGHYGPRFCGAKITVEKSESEAAALSFVRGLGRCTYTDSPWLANRLCIRPAFSVLPFSTSFSDGVGSCPRPWINIRSVDPLPSFLGASSMEALGGWVGRCEQQDDRSLMPVLCSSGTKEATPGPIQTCWIRNPDGTSAIQIKGTIRLCSITSSDEKRSGFATIRLFSCAMQLSGSIKILMDHCSHRQSPFSIVPILHLEHKGEAVRLCPSQGIEMQYGSMQWCFNIGSDTKDMVLREILLCVCLGATNDKSGESEYFDGCITRFEMTEA
jgi:hypothetical protein